MKLEFDVTCPHCKRKFKQRVEDMAPGRSRQCPHCGITVNFTGDDGRKAQQAVDKLEGQIKKLSRTISIRF